MVETKKHYVPEKHDYYKLYVSDAKAEEGRTEYFKISLDHKADHDITVYYVTENGSAKAWEDYKPEYGKVTIHKGEQHAYVDIKTIDDKYYEGTEKFYLKAWDYDKYVDVKDGRGEGTIYDNDHKPTAYIHDATVYEKDKGQVSYAHVKVELKGPHDDTYVKYYTKAGEANNYGKDQSDYKPEGGTLHFGKNEYVKYIDVKIYGDNQNEHNEKFNVYLENSDKYKFGDNHAYVTIVDNDNSTHPTLVPTEHQVIA